MFCNSSKSRASFLSPRCSPNPSRLLHPALSAGVGPRRTARAAASLFLHRQCWFRIKVNRAGSSGDVYIRLFEKLLTLAMLVLCFKESWWLPRRHASWSRWSVAGAVKEWRFWEGPKWFREINPTELSVTRAPRSPGAFGSSLFIRLVQKYENFWWFLGASIRRWVGNLGDVQNPELFSQQCHSPGTKKMTLQVESYSWNPGSCSDCRIKLSYWSIVAEKQEHGNKWICEAINSSSVVTFAHLPNCRGLRSRKEMKQFTRKLQNPSEREICLFFYYLFILFNHITLNLLFLKQETVGRSGSTTCPSCPWSQHPARVKDWSGDVHHRSRAQPNECWATAALPPKHMWHLHEYQMNSL